MLEIMCPLPEHEEWNRTIALLVEVLAEEMRLDVRNFGSTTFRRADLARGFEPDSCFYIQHEADISGKSAIDLTVDPPPDLVIEVDITSGSLDKFPIYAQVGVPEVWRYDGQRLRISILTAGHYVESETSLALPLLTAQRLSETLAQSKALKRTALLRSFRTWVRQERRRQRR
jgi:Uma2 family endonuclease